MKSSSQGASVSLARVPGTEFGSAIANAIVYICGEKWNMPSPCRFRAGKWQLGGRQLEVWVEKMESGKMLCGPDVLSEAVVLDGKVHFFAPNDPQRDGVPTGIKLLDAFAYRVAAAIEESHRKELFVKAGNTKSKSELNLKTALPIASVAKLDISVRAEFK